MRLIYEQMANEAVRKVLRKYGFDDESIVSDEIWDCIENLPTACDVDMLVEQLEERMNENTRCAQLRGNTDTKTISLTCRADEDRIAINLIKNSAKESN